VCTVMEKSVVRLPTVTSQPLVTSRSHHGIEWPLLSYTSNTGVQWSLPDEL